MIHYMKCRYLLWVLEWAHNYTLIRVRIPPIYDARHFGPIFIQTVLWVFRGKLMIEMGFTVLAGPRLNSVCRVDFKFYLIY